MQPEMRPPQAVNTITHESASELINLEETEIIELDEKVREYFEELTSNLDNLQVIKKKSLDIQRLGDEDIQMSASVSSKLLERPMGAMASGFFDDSSAVSRALLDLRETVEELDPSNHRALLTPRRLFGLFPLSGNIKKYFRKFQSAQSHLNAIICSLNNGKDELLKDNAIIEEEKVNMWQSMKGMEQHIYLGRKLDDQVVGVIKKIEMQTPETAKLISEEILFYLRQKTQDLLTQLSVSVQGYLAMDLIAKNNVELVKGIDRSINTTVSALKTAVTVAQALANEKLVLEQIKAINETTSKLIEGTSEALKNQAAEIHGNASNNSIEIDKIKNAFQNIYETIDMIDRYKIDALGNMKETITVLSDEVEKAKTYISRDDSNRVIV